MNENKSKRGIYATRVFDPINGFRLPEGEVALPHQMQGGKYTSNSEYASRQCYSSLGKENTRATPEYFENIITVNHGSVLEHANLTLEFKFPDYISMYVAGLVCLNRPGIWVHFSEEYRTLRMTLNARAAREWLNYPSPVVLGATNIKIWLGEWIWTLFKGEMPEIFYDGDNKPTQNNPLQVKVVDPYLEQELWVSFDIRGVSRSVSLEFVRHGDWTAVSQRSTRYVDESEGQMIHHPLVERYLLNQEDTKDYLTQAHQDNLDVYDIVFEQLNQKLLDEGVDKFTARKQARGAAREYLENGLETIFTFSASLSQWKHIILMRGSDHADAAIRLLANEIYLDLKDLYPNAFETWKSRPAKDGIGFHIEAN